jgi:transcriptional regulator with XRE-family HTH domain
MPARLRGPEIKAIRKIMDLTLAEMAQRMGERTARETVSRWESEAQPMGAYAEKVFRLIVCEALTANAQAVDYHAATLADLVITNDEPELVHLSYVPIKARSGAITGAYGDKLVA